MECNLVARGDKKKAVLVKAAMSIAVWIARSVLQPVLIVALSLHARVGLAAAAGAVYAAYLVLRIATWPKRRQARRQLSEGLELLEKMVSAYYYCNPPVINPSTLNRYLEEAAKAGARFDGAVYTMLERVISRDSSTFLPYVLR